LSIKRNMGSDAPPFYFPREAAARVRAPGQLLPEVIAASHIAGSGPSRRLRSQQIDSDRRISGPAGVAHLLSRKPWLLSRAGSFSSDWTNCGHGRRAEHGTLPLSRKGLLIAGESGEGTNAESDRAILRSSGRFGLAARETLDGGTITGIHAMRSEQAAQRCRWLRDHSPDCPALTVIG
jgi:hypothetical protein